MDKKDKKRLSVLKQKRQKLTTELATVRKFTDDPAELAKLEAELEKVVAEITKIEGG